MSSRSRLILVLVAAIVVVGGFVLASPAENDDTAPAPSAATVTTEDAPVATTGTRTEAQEDAPATTGTEAAPAPKPAAPRVPTLVVEGGRPKGDARELTFSKGERVRFRVRSDVVEELHIHGYDRYVDIGPGKTASVSFPASIEGIFEVELHGTGALLASLRVEP
jgi:hypothetical protein